jgi:hypothetical protein
MEIENEQNENNNQEQKIPFSLQGEIDLVNQEEEENKDGPTQKERLQKIINKLNKETEENNPEENAPQENPENPQNENGEEPQRKVVLRGVKKVLGTVTPTKLNIKKQIPEPFDTTFNLENEYFYKEMESKEWDEITSFLESYISENKSDESELKSFFNLHPSIRKGNAELFLSKINSLNIQNFSTYQALIKFALGEYFQPNPVICECHFFPNPANEEKVVSMIRTCKKTLDIAIFSLTLDSIAEAILEAFQRGIKVRMIADDECAKNKGSNVKLIASVGVPCKTDNAIYHMHHKFAVLDESVVIMGSFNWTGQAVKYNQENIFFYEDKNIAGQYAQEFERLWNSFTTVIDQKEAAEAVENEAKEEEQKKKEKEAKAKEKEKEKAKTVKEQKMEKNKKTTTTKRVRGNK